jgi:hypothetical protein
MGCCFSRTDTVFDNKKMNNNIYYFDDSEDYYSSKDLIEKMEYYKDKKVTI